MIIRFFNTFEPVNTLYDDLVPHLCDHGHEVILVVSSAEYRARPDLSARFGSVRGVRVVKSAHFGVQPRDVWSKVFVHFCYACSAMAHSMFGPRVDVNVFLTQPPFFGTFWAPLLAILRRQDFCFIVLDIYPAAIVVRTRLSETSPVIRLLTWCAASTMNRARCVMTIGRCMRDRLQRMGVRCEIDVVPYWISDDSIYPIPHSQNVMRRDLGWEGKFVVYYGGNVGGAFTFDDLASAAGQLANHDDILFVIMGGGSRLEQVKDICECSGAGNVAFLPLMHHRYSLATILSAADVHFVAVLDEHGGIGVPTKAYGALAAGRAMIYQGRPETEVARMIAEHEIGFTVPNGDVAGLTRAILTLHGSPLLREGFGATARRVAETTHSASAGVMRLREFICEGTREARGCTREWNLVKWPK